MIPEGIHQPFIVIAERSPEELRAVRERIAQGGVDEITSKHQPVCAFCVCQTVNSQGEPAVLAFRCGSSSCLSGKLWPLGATLQPPNSDPRAAVAASLKRKFGIELEYRELAWVGAYRNLSDTHGDLVADCYVCDVPRSRIEEYTRSAWASSLQLLTAELHQLQEQERHPWALRVFEQAFSTLPA